GISLRDGAARGGEHVDVRAPVAQRSRARTVAGAERARAMKSSTVQLRLKGLMPSHVIMAAVAAVPIGRIAYATVVQHLPYPTQQPLMTAVCAVLALLPWLWRAYARA